MDTKQRVTHGHEGELAVFLIGMRINRWWRVDQWLPTAMAMPKMITELYAAKAAAERGGGVHPGFLGHRLLIGGRGPTVVQYWRTVEDVYRYASSPDHEHRPAWAAFNARARTNPGVVGIWHETFAVPAGGHESIYVAMPPTGLAAATTVVPVARRGEAPGNEWRAETTGEGLAGGAGGHTAGSSTTLAALRWAGWPGAGSR